MQIRTEDFWKPLKIILGQPKWKFSVTEGPQPLAADRALFLKSASGLYEKKWNDDHLLGLFVREKSSSL